jgi:hypothetical protein
MRRLVIAVFMPVLMQIVIKNTMHGLYPVALNGSPEMMHLPVIVLC